MLFPLINQCTFEDSDKAQTKLRSLSREAERISSDFGGWLATPRKRKSKPRLEEVPVEKKGGSGGSDKMKLCVKNDTYIKKNDTYYKKYRTDPLEGTFKHFMNYGQYIKVYRETTTLCYKQKTLNELTSLYSATLDIGRFFHRKHRRKVRRWELIQNLDTWSPDEEDYLLEEMYLPCIGVSQESSWQTYTMECEGTKSLSSRVISWHEALNEQTRKSTVTSQSVGIAPLMLLPTAPSIPNARLATDDKPLGNGQAAFMCNAYLNRNTVCPVHRLIHRRNVVISDRNSKLSNIAPAMRIDHIKVELPGIPKRRSDRGSHSNAPPNSKGTTPSGTPGPVDEDEESVSERINALLSNSPISLSEKVSSALSRQKKSSDILHSTGSMQLPITALLQYFPSHNITEVPSKIIKTKSIPAKKRFLRQRKLIELPKKELKQVVSIPPLSYLEKFDKVNYEKEYVRYLADVLESKGRAIQKRHHQNLSKNH